MTRPGWGSGKGTAPSCVQFVVELGGKRRGFGYFQRADQLLGEFPYVQGLPRAQAFEPFDFVGRHRHKAFPPLVGDRDRFLQGELPIPGELPSQVRRFDRHHG